MVRVLRSPAILLLALLAAWFVFHLPDLDAPPRGYHQWRQAQTLAVARNFAEESPDILAPRVDSRGDTDGVAGMEFPLVNWLVAAGYRLFGFHHWVGRLVVFAFAAFGIVQCYRLHRTWFGSPRAGLVAAVLLAASPLFLYYGFVVMPDVPMLALVFGALAHLARWRRDGRERDLAWSCAYLAVGALVKTPTLVAWPLTVLAIARAPGPRARRLAWAALPVLVAAAWVLWARHLSDRTGIHDFKLELTPSTSLADALLVSRKVFLQWLPEVYLDYAEVPLLLAGLVLLARRHPLAAPARGPLLALGLPLAGYMWSQYRMLEMHDYYMTIVLVVLVPVATLGAMALDGRGPRARAALATLLAFALVVGGFRVAQRRGHYDRAHLATLESLESRLDQLGVPRDAKVVVASDPSPSIILYFAHRKGWAIPGQRKPETFPDLVRRGARWLVSDSRALENRPDVRPYLAKVGACGEFVVWAVHTP